MGCSESEAGSLRTKRLLTVFAVAKHLVSSIPFSLDTVKTSLALCCSYNRPITSLLLHNPSREDLKMTPPANVKRDSSGARFDIHRKRGPEVGCAKPRQVSLSSKFVSTRQFLLTCKPSSLALFSSGTWLTPNVKVRKRAKRHHL